MSIIVPIDRSSGADSKNTPLHPTGYLLSYGGGMSFLVIQTRSINWNSIMLVMMVMSAKQRSSLLEELMLIIIILISTMWVLLVVTWHLCTLHTTMHIGFAHLDYCEFNACRSYYKLGSNSRNELVISIVTAVDNGLSFTSVFMFCSLYILLYSSLLFM